MEEKGNIAGLDFHGLYLVCDNRREMLSMRYRTASSSRANAIGQNCGQAPVRWGETFHTGGNYRHFIGKIMGNHNVFYEAMVISERVDDTVIFSTEDDIVSDFYDYLMTHFSLPLLKEWGEYLYMESQKQGCISTVSNAVRIPGKQKPGETTMVHGNREIRLDQLVVLETDGMSEEVLRKLVSGGLANKRIFLDLEGRQTMERLNVKGMDEYNIKFGKSLCENMEKERIRPKSPELKKSVPGLALLDRKLYPAQASTVNGIVASMYDRDSYIFVSGEPGCGKTILTAAAIEAYYNQKWLKAHPGKSLKDCFMSGEVAYRVPVMCPSHSCAKWKSEVEKQIPGARGILVTDISQLEELRRTGRKERNGKEFYIFSEEFAKGDTYKSPVPTKIAARIPVANVCYDCLEASAEEQNTRHQRILAKKGPWTREDLDGSLARNFMMLEGGVPTCPQCRGHNAHLYELNYPHSINEHSTLKYTGLCCPSCGNLLWKMSPSVCMGNAECFSDYVLTPPEFLSKKKGNEACGICGTPLWEDNVRPMDIPLKGHPVPLDEGKKVVMGENGMPQVESMPHKKWVKIKFVGNYAKAKEEDKRKRLNKSGYALRGHELETVMVKGKGKEYEYQKRDYGPRRYSPARFASRYLRGYFDVLIADEAHEYEGCRTERAIALHGLIKTVRYTMLLTGTLTNGTASSLFNIQFLVNPGLMKKFGYSYTNFSAKAFAEKYGVVEREYEICGNPYGNYNAQGRGRQIGTLKIKPGISPKIYPDFLLNHTVQINIADMAVHMPPLNEFVCQVDMNTCQVSGYMNGIAAIKDSIGHHRTNIPLLSKMLQYGLSYPDKPYGRSDIWSYSQRDTLVLRPKNYEQFRDVNNLLPKEEALVDIIRKELEEDRNVFVYTEYSGNEEMDIDGRLRDIIEYHCNLKGQVAVLKSKDVRASDREEYIKKNSDRVRVWITNYRNVQTSIDFVGEYRGRMYNYPTLVFFQTGMVMTSVQQASRRGYRLNQMRECRTYYLVYKDTFQMDMLESMSKKMSAASAIQGNFSESALENMMGTEDPVVMLARKIMEGRTGGEDNVDIESQFLKIRQNAMNSCDESIYAGEEPVTYYEVMGQEVETVLFKVDASAISTAPASAEPGKAVEEEAFEEPRGSFEALILVSAEDLRGIRKKSAKPIINQLAFF